LYLFTLKKCAAILLLGILLFNGWGYRLLTSYMESRANHQLEVQLDNDQYDESQLVSIRIPATRLSYYNNSFQYERVRGEIEIRGLRYKYCKRRILNDSIEFLCIPNQAAMKMQTARDDFFQLMNDLSRNGLGKNSSSLIHRHIPADDYISHGTQTIHHPVVTPSAMSYPDVVVLSSWCALTPDQPPELVG
jgi:hypothetical protein